MLTQHELDFFRKALELFSAFHSAKDLVFPNLLASFKAVLVLGVPSLAVNFSTDGGRVDEPEEVRLPCSRNAAKCLQARQVEDVECALFNSQLPL